MGEGALSCPELPDSPVGVHSEMTFSREGSGRGLRVNPLPYPTLHDLCPLTLPHLTLPPALRGQRSYSQEEDSPEQQHAAPEDEPARDAELVTEEKRDVPEEEGQAQEEPEYKVMEGRRGGAGKGGASAEATQEGRADNYCCTLQPPLAEAAHHLSWHGTGCHGPRPGAWHLHVAHGVRPADAAAAQEGVIAWVWVWV